MSDTEAPDKNGRPEDESMPETAPEVPDFAVVSDAEDQDLNDDAEAPKKIAVTFSDEHDETVDAPSDEHSNNESHEASDDHEIVPVDHQIAASVDDTPLKSKRSKKRLFAYGGFIAVNIAILAATLVVLRLPQKQVAASGTTVVSAKDPSSSNIEAAKTPETPQSVHYVSDAMKLEFDYPSDWRISSNPDNTYVTIQSAPFKVKRTDGTQEDVRGSMTIYSKYTDSILTVDSKAHTADGSDKLVYKNPTKIQRTETHLSYSAPSLYGGDVVTDAFISSDLEYQAGQSVGSKNFRKTNPFIIFRLTTCQEGCGQTNDYVPVSSDVFKQTAEFLTAKDIITSMRFNE